jgi:hypothetical protein
VDLDLSLILKAQKCLKFIFNPCVQLSKVVLLELDQEVLVHKVDNSLELLHARDVVL